MRNHVILRVIAKLLIPFIILFGLYVQFHGDFGPGGGFQAGVIIAAAGILYGLVFGLERLRRAIPPKLVQTMMAIGLLIYGGTGVVTVLLGGLFLDYQHLAHEAEHGHEYGIITIEFGVGMTVTSVMLMIYYVFAGRAEADED